MQRLLRRKPMPTSENAVAKAKADRMAIERWEDEGGTPLPRDGMPGAGTTRHRGHRSWQSEESQS